MDNFDYRQFAKYYINPWMDRDVRRGLKKLTEPGFDYEDNVDLSSKHLLLHIKPAAQVGPGTFLVEFEHVKAGENSDCLGAIERYLRVFFCERGLASSYEDSIQLLGECDTEFHGLLKDKLYASKDFRAAHISLNMENVQSDLAVEEVRKALTALTDELEARRDAASRIRDGAVSSPHLK